MKDKEDILMTQQKLKIVHKIKSRNLQRFYLTFFIIGYATK